MKIVIFGQPRTLLWKGWGRVGRGGERRPGSYCVNMYNARKVKGLWPLIRRGVAGE